MIQIGLDMYYYRSSTQRQMYHEDPSPVQSCDGIPIPWENLGGVAASIRRDRIGYQRKANAIHDWIVRNVADGEDECQEIDLDEDAINLLYADIEAALADPEGNDVLAPASGFFFGGTERDEYYVQDLKDAKDILDWIRADIARTRESGDEDIDVEYSYRASW